MAVQPAPRPDEPELPELEDGEIGVSQGTPLPGGDDINEPGKAAALSQELYAGGVDESL